MSVTPVRMVGARVLRAVFGVVSCTLLAAGAVAAAFSEINRTIAGTGVLSAAVAEHALLPAAVCIAVVPEAVAGCQKTLTVAARKLPLCGTDAHLAVYAVGLAVLIRGAGPIE